MASTKVSFVNLGTDDGLTEWGIWLGNPPADKAPGDFGCPNYLGTISRERPARYHANGVSGLVSDHSKPWIWNTEFTLAPGDGAPWAPLDLLADGLSANEAKAAVRAAVVAYSRRAQCSEPRVKEIGQ